MTKIGVWNTAFLGDAILTLPLLQTLRAAYPDAVIDFWVRKGFKGLFASHPALTNVYEYDKRGRDKGALQALRLGRALGRERYGLWISAHGSLRSGMLARWSSAKVRIGYAEPRANAWFYTHTVPRLFTEFEEVERLLRLLLPLDLGARGVPLSGWPDIVLPQEAADAAERFFASLAAERAAPVLGVHPGSIWGTKRWPLEYFAAIAAKAAREGARVLVFGGPGDEEAMAEETVSLAVNELSKEDGKSIINLAAKLSLPELAAFIGRLSCYLTNDSGPMHLAWPQKTPVTALFGPTVRELGFFPRGEGATVMELPLPCRPCGLHGPQECPLQHHKCMRDMTPEMVWPDVAAKMFATPPGDGREGEPHARG
ncbi:Lipopolysaccharide heptosyltransferase II [uncultured delta proteobacterium]|uniref:Lipopolysaccharide heptosyltransferase II n=1 Tax=uncultured delta proteobacterium TaxID=34034 RepID=A0A212JDM5_9DELT|nr:Lipopolysaccharide heptosyltransferase II [uncultured delta proteobacterium]